MSLPISIRLCFRARQYAVALVHLTRAQGHLSLTVCIHSTPPNTAHIATCASLLNNNLRTRTNQLPPDATGTSLSLQLHHGVELCLLDTFSFFDFALCDRFGITTALTMVPELLSKAEYTSTARCAARRCS